MIDYNGICSPDVYIPIVIWIGSDQFRYSSINTFCLCISKSRVISLYHRSNQLAISWNMNSYSILSSLLNASRDPYSESLGSDICSPLWGIYLVHNYASYSCQSNTNIQSLIKQKCFSYLLHYILQIVIVQNRNSFSNSQINQILFSNIL